MDARALVNTILRDVRAVARIEAREMGVVSGDLIGPLGEVLGAVVRVLEGVESGSDGELYR